MSHYAELLSYFNKLSKVLKMEGEIQLFGFKFIKKMRIDDILCCIIASFPQSYKAFLKKNIHEKQKYSSVISFDVMYKKIKNPFFLNQDLYLVDYRTALKMIDTITKTIDNDIIAIEKKG